MHDHVRRMLDEAKAYIYDASILGESLRSESSAQALLQVLALEILLKAAGLAYTGKYSRTHKYAALWADLPDPIRNEVLARARNRYPGHADLSDVDALLSNWQYIFTKVRYHYELYEQYSLAEQRALGELWVQLGAPIDESVVRFQPMELTALLESLVYAVENAP